MTDEESPASETGANGPSSSPRSRRAFLASAAAASVAVAGCTGTSSEPAGDTPGTTSEPSGDTTGTSPGSGAMPSVKYRHRFKFLGLGSAPNSAGVEMGLWEEEGVNVEFLPSSGSQAAAQSVAQGKDMFGNGETVAPLKLIQKGAPLTIIGQVIDPLGGVISLAETGIESWADLEGKTIGRFPWATTGKLAPQAMAKQGADPETVTWRNMQPGAQEKLLIQGEIDAAVAYFPQAEVRLQAKGHETNSLALSEVLPYLGVSLFTRDEIVENRPELVNRFVRGWLKANRVFATKLDRVVEIQKNYVASFNEEVERKTVGPLYAARVPRRELGTEYGKGWTPPEALRGTQEVLHEAGMLEETRSIDTYYTNEYIERNRDLAVDTAKAYYERLSQDFDVGPNYV